MNAYEYIVRAKKLNRLIEAKLAERDRIREISADFARSLNGKPFSEENTGRAGAIAVRLMSAEEELDALIDEYAALRKEISGTLEKLPAEYYAVLHRYYIRGMTVHEIAEELHYCERQVFRLKKRGLKKLELYLTEKAP